MKTCAGPNCKTEISDNYQFCYNHYQAGQKKTDMKSGQWTEDATVDQLMKINANLGKLVQNLNSLCSIMEANRVCMYCVGKKGTDASNSEGLGLPEEEYFKEDDDDDD